MQYKIIVDTQSRTNPSGNAKEYIIDIEELRYLGDVHDSLIITYDEDYVMRRLSLSKYHVLTVLDEPIKESIEGVNIELFEGDNYIYIEDMTGNVISASYVIKNEFTDTYATKIEMNATISVVANEINQKVEKKVDEEIVTGAYLIQKINGDTSESLLKADKISLEGYTTINGGFSVDEEGNASIANGAVAINTNGIQMADGTSIVGGKGIYTNLTFTSLAVDAEFSNEIGYFYDENYGASEQKYLRIIADIPSNFTITSATISIRHRPVKWHYYASATATSQSTTTGYARNVQIYNETFSALEDVYVDSEYSLETSTPGTATTTLGSSGKTFSSSAVEAVTSSDLSSYLTPGSQTVFNIGSTTSASSITSASNAYARTGLATAVLTVIGFMK